MAHIPHAIIQMKEIEIKIILDQAVSVFILV